jgi:ribonuclease M5
MNDIIALREAIIVEGRYDRIRLSGIISTPVIETGGFRVFKDKEKQALIRSIAERRGILIMTDVDSAGFVIRNFLKGIIPQEKIKHAYIPTVKGKEKRKPEPSKEGTLGVEGLDRDSLIKAIIDSGAHIENVAYSVGEVEEHEPPFPKGGGTECRRVPAAISTNASCHCEEQSDVAISTDTEITKLDFFDYGLTGSENSAKHRAEVLASLGLPEYLTVNAMISALNCLFTKQEFEAYLENMNKA